jgi:hypothetical protein
MTEEAKALPAEVSPETLKVLEAIKQDGEIIEGVDLPENKETPEAKEEESTEETESEEESKPEKQVRDSKFVPVGKFNQFRKENAALKKQLVELDDKIKVMSAQPKGIETEIADKARDFAGKYGFDEVQARDLLQIVADIADKKATNLDLQKKVELYEAERQKMEEDRGFEKEFAEVSKTYPELASVKDDFKRLSFTEGYERTPLPVLAAWYSKEFKPRVTAEHAVKGKSSEVIDFENLTEEQLKALPEKEFLKYMSYQDKKAGLNI